jgi:Ca2+-transporting ATPase
MVEDRRYEWNPALEEIRDQLTFLKKVRGGRLKHLKHKLQNPATLIPRSRSGSRSQELSAPGTPVGDGASPSQPPMTPEARSRSRGRRSRSDSAFGPAAAMAGIVAGSIAGWSPVDRSQEDIDAVKFSGTGPHSGVLQPGIEIHPKTSADDPIIADYNPASKIPPSQNPDLTPVFAHAPPPPGSHSPSRSRRSASHHSQRSANAGADAQV